MRVIPGNATTLEVPAFTLPIRERATVGVLQRLAQVAIFAPAGLRYDHPGAWEVTHFGPGPPVAQFYGQEAIRHAGQRAAEAKDLRGALEAVTFRPLGAVL